MICSNSNRPTDDLNIVKFSFRITVMRIDCFRSSIYRSPSVFWCTVVAILTLQTVAKAVVSQVNCFVIGAT